MNETSGIIREKRAFVIFTTLIAKSTAAKSPELRCVFNPFQNANVINNLLLVLTITFNHDIARSLACDINVIL